MPSTANSKKQQQQGTVYTLGAQVTATAATLQQAFNAAASVATLAHANLLLNASAFIQQAPTLVCNASAGAWLAAAPTISTALQGIVAAHKPQPLNTVARGTNTGLRLGSNAHGKAPTVTNATNPTGKFNSLQAPGTRGYAVAVRYMAAHGAPPAAWGKGAKAAIAAKWPGINASSVQQALGGLAYWYARGGRPCTAMQAHIQAAQAAGNNGWLRITHTGNIVFTNHFNPL